MKCDDAGTERAKKPLVMAVKIGGISGEAYEITYDERELRYYSARRITALMKAKPVIIKPTEAQWQGFYDELEKLQVWKWKRHYANETMLDGTYWDACIIYSTGEPRDLAASGSNAYPEGFQAFLAAVRKLVGGREFR